MRFDILTIFPNIFDSYLNESLVKRAREEKIIDVKVHNLRDFTTDKHQRVDARPFGGGPGMVLQVEPIWRAVQHVRNVRVVRTSNKRSDRTPRTRVIVFSTRGKKLDSKTAKRLSKYDRLILICGRYEGVDERVAEHIADEEISIGDYVLSGGELPALVTMEAVSRYLPGFLGRHESLEDIGGSHPTYTRPPKFFPKKLGKASPKEQKGKKVIAWSVPKVLLSGDHKKIEAWRRRT